MPATSTDFQTLCQQLERCLAVDRARLARRVRGLEKRARGGKPVDRGLEEVRQQIRASVARREQRAAGLPRPEYPGDLPIVDKRGAILEALKAHQVMIVCGETGSGKTTQLPKLCLELGRGVDGMIGHTQPRRIAARSLSARIAEELNDKVGGAVGFKVRFTDQVGAGSYIKVMTDGILLAETRSDPDLLAYDTLIIDEAHERSLNVDFLLGYLKRLLPRRPDLKVIITSATIDPERFSKHFDGAPVVEVSGRTYPVEVRYRPPHGEDEDERDRDRGQAMLDAVDELAREGPGDILVFLAGERDIREAAELLRKHHPPGTEILPLYGRLSAAQQNQVFQPHKGRRIVLATNVAETSLTVPGIRYVVDTGLARLSRYSYRTKVQRLPIEPVSQASANQRAGRCGRVAPGVCVRLYSEEDFQQRPEFTDPEILRTNLASVILQMLVLKLGDIEDFPFVEPPDTRYIRDGFKLLFELGAVDERNALTGLGGQLARLPMDVRLGRMLLAGDRERCLNEMLVITSALAIQDPRERPMEKQQAADEKHAAFVDERSDFIAYLKLWEFYTHQAKHLSQNKLRKLCQTNFLSYVRMREWRETHHQLRGLVRELGLRINSQEGDYTSLHKALIAGLLNNLAFRDGEHEYTGARDLKLYLFPGSGLFRKKPKWIVAAELVETTQRYARTVAAIEPQWVEPLARHLVKRTWFDPHWQKERGRAAAREQVSLYGLILVPGRKVDYSRVDPPHARELFIRHALVHGEVKSKLPFFAHNREQHEQVHALEARSRRRDILADEDSLYEHFARILPEDIADISRFERWYRRADKQTQQRFFLDGSVLMQHAAESVTEQAYPPVLNVDGMELPLEYHFEPGHERDGVTVKIPPAALNQLEPARFGWLVPGLLEEKIAALIKSLPKALRRNFVPAPEFARACVQALKPQPAPLHEKLGEELHRMTGVAVPADAWRPDTLPDHLHMFFQVLKPDGGVLAAGRDLAELQQRAGSQASASFSRMPVGDFERDNLQAWDFDDLPDTLEMTQHGVKLKGYPALVADDGQVHLRVLDAAGKAARAHREGVLALFRIRAKKSVRYLEKNLPDIQALCLQYASVGGCAELQADLMHTVLKTALFENDTDIRTRADFERNADWAERQLVPVANRCCAQAGEVLAAYRRVMKRLKSSLKPQWLTSVQDIQAQLAHLVYPGFVRDTSAEHLPHLPRYLEAIEIRLEKLERDPQRDAQLTKEVAPFWQHCLSQLEDEETPENLPAEFQAFRWMVEEFRVSLFAQKLGTRETVSTKRLKRMWDEIQR